ncbi:TetR/AcrR family transcriptional regulator [Nocardiopsis suaedae]|uniref:TetR/AcrR family transcriptional regulator n=1 Tax=Nocardiopsis suaedae TaxID=3018444 RepID=A0ABT4TFV1_9ACTN|nr:TetR/AcrR family transcriptional regulator [Nocardiopsis suaedae]MDA2803589.1 TetR/AcrR family transcriptional regulator [Nocardiopsis suaedae]
MPAPISEEQNRRDREVLLDAAEGLFYEHGIRAVGMDAVRAGAGLPLKRIYRFFPAKEELLVEVLRRRDRRWRGDLAEHVGREDDPRARVAAVFDWLAEWFTRPGFRGCAWINAFGEMGTASEAVLAEVRAHKEAFRAQVEGWVRDAGGGREEADAVFLLAEGAIVTAGISGGPAPARRARAAAERLLQTR